MFLHRRQVRHYAYAVALKTGTNHLVRGVESVEVVLAVVCLVEEGGPPAILDRGVVHLASQQHLGVAVQQRCARPPKAVPEEEIVLRGWVGAVRQGRPALAGVEVVVDLLACEAQRVLLFEDDQPVQAIELGDVAGRDAPFALHPAERVLRREREWIIERLAAVQLQLLLQVELLAPDWTLRAKPVEEHAFQRYDVRHLHDLLVAHHLHVAEALLDPGTHRVRRHEVALRDAHVEDAFERDPIFNRQLRNQLIEPRHRQIRGDGHACSFRFVRPCSCRPSGLPLQRG